MDRNQAKTLSPIIKAFSEGKTIQSRCIKGDTSLWYDDEDPSFDGDFEYRIKPEPKYRPFKNKEECWAEMQKHQPIGWIKGKVDGLLYLIAAVVSKNDIRVDGVFLSLDCIEESYTFADGTPFGIKLEE